jgi:predicted nucleotidyltransferase
MLSKLLGSKLRAKVLGWLFLHPDERYFVRQLKGLLDDDSTNISRELARLEKMGILTCQTEGRQKYYQVNRECPVFSELEGLVRKTAGLADVLRDAIKPLSKKIKIAFIYGSMATGSIKRQSDVDLMVIGSAKFGEVVNAISKAQHKLGREINPTVYPLDEFKQKALAKHHFINTVLKEPKFFLIGDEYELAKLAQRRLGHQT